MMLIIIWWSSSYDHDHHMSIGYSASSHGHNYQWSSGGQHHQMIILFIWAYMMISITMINHHDWNLLAVKISPLILNPLQVYTLLNLILSGSYAFSSLMVLTPIPYPCVLLPYPPAQTLAFFHAHTHQSPLCFLGCTQALRALLALWEPLKTDLRSLTYLPDYYRLPDRWAI